MQKKAFELTTKQLSQIENLEKIRAQTKGNQTTEGGEITCSKMEIKLNGVYLPLSKNSVMIPNKQIEGK